MTKHEEVKPILSDSEVEREQAAVMAHLHSMESMDVARVDTSTVKVTASPQSPIFAKSILGNDDSSGSN